MAELAKKKDETRELVLQMNPEQLADWMEISLQINFFSEEMKKRFAEKTLEDKTGWENVEEADSRLEIQKRIRRLYDGNQKVDIGLANWAFIHWYNRTKAGRQIQMDVDTLPQLDIKHIQKALEGLILKTPTGSEREALTQAQITLWKLVMEKEGKHETD